MGSPSGNGRSEQKGVNPQLEKGKKKFAAPPRRGPLRFEQVVKASRAWQFLPA